jgi:hypothetical protein
MVMRASPTRILLSAVAAWTQDLSGVVDGAAHGLRANTLRLVSIATCGRRKEPMGSHRAGRRVRVGTVAWSLLAAIAWSGSAVAPIARADDQIGSSAPNVHGAGFVPLTKEELRIVALKEEAARREAASLRGAGGGGVAPATCPLTVVNGGTPATACPPYRGYLSTTPRQQQKSYYCGPTAVQVVSNYVWGVVDRYTQQYISTTWTNTDNDGQTYVWPSATG